MNQDIWILLSHGEGEIEETGLSLAVEARRLGPGPADTVTVTGMVWGDGLDQETVLAPLGAYGLDKVIYLKDPALNDNHPEVTAALLARQVRLNTPGLILCVGSAESDETAVRLAARLECPMVRQAVDLTMTEAGLKVVRPVAGGFLFEDLGLPESNPAIVSLIPSVLAEPQPVSERRAEVIEEPVQSEAENRKIRLLETIEADPSELDIEEADIIVAGGRGVGKGDAFDIVFQLAEALGGSVGATRPIIDWHTVEFERQIGQTGKTVSPRLIVNCGISGANEYTAGMEKSQQVIAIDRNPKARIFRFADLSVVGDLHEILPLLIERIREKKAAEAETETKPVTP